MTWSNGLGDSSEKFIWPPRFYEELCKVLIKLLEGHPLSSDV
jgi:hypothetical protein